MASTKPYGFQRFEPGPGTVRRSPGVDPFYLTWRVREFHLSPEHIELDHRGADRAGRRAQRALLVCRLAAGPGSRESADREIGRVRPRTRERLPQAGTRGAAVRPRARRHAWGQRAEPSSGF
jgi:hypothetical protein